MEKKFLIDTNIIIYFITGKIPEKAKLKLLDIFKTSFNISTITKIETLGWHRISDSNKNRYTNFMNAAKVYYINEKIKEIAIELKQSRKIDVPDAVIGATALFHDFVILTRNSDDFKKIKGLEIYNPFL